MKALAVVIVLAVAAYWHFIYNTPVHEAVELSYEAISYLYRMFGVIVDGGGNLIGGPGQ